MARLVSSGLPPAVELTFASGLDVFQTLGQIECVIVAVATPTMARHTKPHFQRSRLHSQSDKAFSAKRLSRSAATRQAGQQYLASDRILSGMTFRHPMYWHRRLSSGSASPPNGTSLGPRQAAVRQFSSDHIVDQVTLGICRDSNLGLAAP